MRRAIRTLLHNCIAHPLAGLCWFGADVLRWHYLDTLGERLHNVGMDVE